MASQPKEKLQLYSYYFSSCSHRVRIALNLKGLDYDYKAVDLRKCEQFSPEFEKLNPVKYVPVLVDGDTVVSDSFAIILYLEDKYPQHPLLPQDLQMKALNIQVASIVCSTIQPLQRSVHIMSVLPNADEKRAWGRHHVGKGLLAIEKLLEGVSGKYATGSEIQLADVFLAPQIYAALDRFQVDMSSCPTLAKLHEAYMQHPAFQAALPDKQPDAPSS